MNAKLEVGTQLVEYFGYDSMALTTVVRLTATQAITARGTRYRLSDGHAVGGYGTATIATDKHREEVKRRKIAQEVVRRTEGLRNYRTVRELPPETLEALLAVLPEATP